MLSQPSDVSDLVPSRLVSISLLSPTFSAMLHICLSQAYGCSDHYNKNSDLRSEVSNDTGLNSTTLCLIPSVALVTKLIGISTPLILSIVVAAALR